MKEKAEDVYETGSKKIFFRFLFSIKNEYFFKNILGKLADEYVEIGN